MKNRVNKSNNMHNTDNNNVVSLTDIVLPLTSISTAITRMSSSKLAFVSRRVFVLMLICMR